MRYINNQIDKEFFKAMIEEVAKGYRALADTLSSFTNVEIEPLPVKLNGMEFPFPMAADLWNIYLFMLGEKTLCDHDESVINKITCDVWQSPFLPRAQSVNWLEWENTKLGFFMRCATVAVKLNHRESINSKELALVSGVTISAITSRAIAAGRIKAEKVGREWQIKADDALSFINRKA